MAATYEANPAHSSELSAESRSSVITRASAILDAFRHGSDRLLLSDLTEATGLPRSTAFRLISQLVDVGWLERDADRQGYRLGRRLISVGERFNTHSHLRKAAHPVLNEVHSISHLFVHLGVLEADGKVYYLDKIGVLPGVNFPSHVGFRWPAERTSVGKSILSMISLEEAEEIIKYREFEDDAKLDFLRHELLRSRRASGIATVRARAERGVITSVGAPIMGPDGPVGAIAVSGYKVEPQPLLPLVLAAARKVSMNLFPGMSHQRESGPSRGGSPRRDYAA